MGVGTNVRAGRLWRTLLAAQSAKGTAVDNLTNATQLWTVRAGADISPGFIDPEWWMSYGQDFNNARYAPDSLARESFTTYATPSLLSAVLQSLYGTYSSPNFTATGYVSKWMSLVFVEDKTLTNTGLQFMRFADAFLHSLTIDVDARGYVTARTEYAAETSEETTIDLAEVDGATFPAAPMDDVDLNVFPGRSVTLRRDPSGENDLMPFERLSITLDAGLDADWDMCGQRERAKKGGPLKATIVAQVQPSDQHWHPIQDGLDDMKSTYRLTMTAPNNHVFTLTFHNVTFNSSPLTLENRNYDSPVLTGLATQDSSDNFLSISLT